MPRAATTGSTTTTRTTRSSTTRSTTSALPSRRARAAAVADAVLGGPLPGQLARWDTPATTYAVLQGSTLLLLGIGLVMVLSSSSVDSLTAGRSAYTEGASQAVFAAAGLVAMLVASRVPVRLLARLAPLVVLVALALQMLVFSPLGVVILGNRNWISVGGFSLQPSEVGKIALAVWCAAVLARRGEELTTPRRWVLPLAVGVLPVIGAVLAGHDVGTSLIMLLLVAAAVFTAGVPLRLMAVPSLLGLAVVALFVVSSADRRGRIEALVSGSGTDVLGENYQPIHGLWALASGGLTGVGLGGSRQKWDWLPEANSDYIFAIIGEELGLVGTLVVLALFAALGWACARAVRASDDLFVKVLVGGVMAWVLGQAAVNIAVVLKLLPVIGLPLPLISAGGSALICTLTALGIVLSCVRSLPGARASLALRAPLRRRARPAPAQTASRPATRAAGAR